LGREVRAQRAEIKHLCAKAGAKNVRVFGSVARGQETALSDIDLLVDINNATGLFTLVALRGELERLLNAGVDLVPAVSLKDGVRDDVIRDMVRL
jgi:predicted nucleotidyltransferase